MSIITEIQHRSHPHQLKLLPVDTPYCCYGCKIEGQEPCYQCTDCGFYLHEECSSGSPTFHPFFKKSKFRFYDNSKDQRHVGFCAACGKSVKGFRYHALFKKAPVFLHPCCLKLKTEIKDEGAMVNLMLCKKLSWPSKCLKCKRRKLSEEVRGWAYVSTCGYYNYHVGCVQELILEKWREAYFRQQSGGETLSTGSLVVEHGGLTGIMRARGLSSSKIQGILKLIITAIFGEGISVIIKLVSGT